MRTGKTVIPQGELTWVETGGAGVEGKWTSRGRVEAALDHREADRVPTDLSITLDAYVRLREWLGLPVDEEVQADRFFEVRPSLDVLEALSVDMTFIKLRSPRDWETPPPLEDESVLDIWGVGRRLVELPTGSHLWEVTYSPWGHLSPTDINLATYPWPDPHAQGIVDGLEEEARDLYENTDLALMGRFGGPILEIAAYLRGFEQWLLDLLLYPDFARDVLEVIADIQIALDRKGIEAAGKYLSVFKVSGEDLGMQDRPLFSPRIWNETLYPVLERRWKAAREALDHNGAAHVKIMLHSDGAIRPFIPDIIAAGVEVLDPVQGVCAGMELAGLKRDFGDRLAFHGSVDTQFTLPFGRPEDVQAAAVRSMEALGHGGGLILGSSHFIQSDVPPENVVALFKTAQQYGRYPLDKIYDEAKQKL
jgi:uroporphyrinogen decarboxylase